MPTHAVHRPAEERKELILKAALSAAEKVGYQHVTRKQIAKKAGVAPALVSARLGTMAQVRVAIMRQAIATENARIVGQGLASNDRAALQAPESLKQAAVATLIR